MEPARIRIKQAFRGLLSKEAFSKISVAEICREAKLSRVTFYLWYDGKDTLLNDCFQDIVNEGMHYFSQFRNDSSVSSVKTDCHALLETIFYLASEYHEFASHLFIDSGKEDQFLYSRFNTIVMQKVTELMKEHSRPDCKSSDTDRDRKLSCRRTRQHDPRGSEERASALNRSRACFGNAGSRPVNRSLHL
jgi:AcrR family transcriptional regulator